MEILESVLCALAAIVVVSCLYPLRLGRTDAYAFYVRPEGRRQTAKVHRHHSLWRYLFRYLIAHKNYLLNTAAMWGVACVLPVLLGQMEARFVLPIGFAILSLNTPLCILLSCDPALERAVRFLPGQLACFLFSACVIIVLAATVITGASNAATADRSLNLVPFRGLQETWGMPEPKKIAQTVANVVMFIPLGLMMPVAFRRMRNFWKTALSLALFSFAIEFTQYFTGRSADIDDLMLNTLGGVLGYLLFFVVSKLPRKSILTR